MERLKTSIENLKYRLVETANLGENELDWLGQIEEMKKKFIQEMNDDFNSANAIAVLFDLAKLANVYLREDHTSQQVLKRFIDVFNELAAILGINLSTKEELLDEEIEALIAARNEARKAKDFSLADKIRDDLKEKNIILEDTPQGVRWKRVKE